MAKRTQVFTPEEVRARLRAAIKAYGDGTQRSWARARGVSPAYVCDVLKGRRAAGPKIVGPLGLLRTDATVFEGVR